MTVGFGMIGAGQMAHIHAVAIAEQAPGAARLVAVTSGSRAPALAAEFGAEAEPSIESLLARKDIDAVVIATPHTAHLPNVLAAAAAGKHIVLEKPMGLDVDECRQMIDACDAAGVYLSLAKISRWLEAVRVGHDLVRRRRGRRTARHPRPPALPGLPQHRLAARSRARAGRGSTGAATAATSSAGSRGASPSSSSPGSPRAATDMPGPDRHGHLRVPGRPAGQPPDVVRDPGTAATERAHYTIVGTEAVVDVHAYGGVDILRGDTREAVYRDERFTDANTTWDEHAPYFRRGFAAQVRDLVEAVEDGRPPTIDGEDGLDRGGDGDRRHPLLARGHRRPPLNPRLARAPSPAYASGVRTIFCVLSSIQSQSISAPRPGPGGRCL